MDFVLGYLEIAVTEACNLNCRACSHFSPLANSDDRVSLASFKRDAYRIHELFPVIYTIRLLGGEPLLHEDVFSMASYIRSLYPRTSVRIATNGLLIPSLSQDALSLMRENQIGFDISLYEPTAKMRDCIEGACRDQGVSFTFTEPIERFRVRFDPTGQNDGSRSYRKCVVGSRCTYLYNGMLSGCPAPNVVHLFNRAYGTDITGEADLIDIHHTELTAEEIYAKISSELCLCRYCTDIEEVNWRLTHGDASMEDWIAQKRNLGTACF